MIICFSATMAATFCLPIMADQVVNPPVATATQAAATPPTETTVPSVKHHKHHHQALHQEQRQEWRMKAHDRKKQEKKHPAYKGQ